MTALSIWPYEALSSTRSWACLLPKATTPRAAPFSTVRFWAERRKPLPTPSSQILDFGAINSGNTTEFVVAGGGCPGTSAAPAAVGIGATKIVLKTATSHATLH